MAYNFKKKAQEQTTVSALMTGRTKLTTDEVMRTYRDGFTVVGIDKVNATDGAYYIAIISEDAGVFINGGAVFNSICDAWVNDFDGNVDALNNELWNSGGVTMKFEKAKSKNTGRTYTAVEIL